MHRDGYWDMRHPSTNEVGTPRVLRCRGSLLALCAMIGLVFASMNVHEASARECGAEIIADLVGSGNVAEISAIGQAGCEKKVSSVESLQTSYYTFEIACTSDRRAAIEGICTTTPCSGVGRFFAFRTIHRPDGSSGPAGFSCVTLEQAVATPGITVAQVFDAVRRVKLPGGEIGVEPQARGLANLASFFWVEGVNQPPVELQVGGST